MGCWPASSSTSARTGSSGSGSTTRWSASGRRSRSCWPIARPIRCTGTRPCSGSPPCATTSCGSPRRCGSWTSRATSIGQSQSTWRRFARADKEGGDYAKLLAEEKAKRIDTTKLAHGRKVFAHNCIVCHSSIQPPDRFEALAKQSAGGEFWDHDPGRWIRDEAYLKWAEAAVEEPDFWQKNFLSTDYRIPINLVQTNSARAMATNGMTGHMWSDYSSADFQKLPSVGSIPYFNPFLGESGGDDQYTPRHKAPDGAPPGGGGPGFYRVPTLISIWTSAPLLHNNSLGLFNNDPSVDGRLLAFDDAIRKLLWPEKRLLSSSYNGATADRLAKDHGLIWRTPEETYLTLPAREVPGILSSRFAPSMRLLDWFPWLSDFRWLFLPAALIVLSFVVLFRWPRGKVRVLAGYVPLVLALVIGFLIYFVNGRLGDFRLGPIPKGTPVNLLANLNPDAEPADVVTAPSRSRRRPWARSSRSSSASPRRRRSSGTGRALR